MLVFDHETLGVDFRNPAWIFNDEEKRIHCIWVIDRETKQEYRFRDVEYAEVPRSGTIIQGLKMLADAKEIGGHNISGFDIPYTQVIYRDFKPTGIIRDSKVESELWYPSNELKSLDFKALAKYKKWIPQWMFGSHSLGAWGLRLKCPKDEYKQACKDQGIEDPWGAWNVPMEDYCMQDVRSNIALFEYMESKNPYEQAAAAVALENKVAPILHKLTQHGVTFNKDEAIKLHSELAGRQEEIRLQLQSYFPPYMKRAGNLKTVKRTMKRFVESELGSKTRKYRGNIQKGWYEYHEEGAVSIPVKLVDFNPGSRQAIANRLMVVYGWEPTKHTDKGAVQVDEEIMKDLPYEPAELITEYLLIGKRLGQIASGDQAWLKQERNGRIHGKIHQNGTRTTRGSHHSPNLGQVPKVGKPHGAECRACFGPSKGRVQVGCDLSGIELRALGHYLARYDGGAYAREAIEGDVHEEARKTCHFNSRDHVKTLEYAFLYGAFDTKLGWTVIKDKTPAQLEKIIAKHGPLNDKLATKMGRATRQNLEQGINGLDPLVRAVKKAAKRKRMRALDGRWLKVPSQHSALNTLLQHLGGLLAKVWMVLIQEELEKQNLVEPLSWVAWPEDLVHLMLWVHDEVQQDCDPAVAEQVAAIDIECAKRAGEFFNLRVKVDAEAKIGKNWRECH